VSKACVWVFKALRQKITSNSKVTAYYETFVLEDKLSSVVLDDLKASEQVRIVLNNRKRSKPVLFLFFGAHTPYKPSKPKHTYKLPTLTQTFDTYNL
jgi:hypothetical protein